MFLILTKVHLWMEVESLDELHLIGQKWKNTYTPVGPHRGQLGRLGLLLTQVLSLPLVKALQAG